MLFCGGIGTLVQTTNLIYTSESSRPVPCLSVVVVLWQHCNSRYADVSSHVYASTTTR